MACGECCDDNGTIHYGSMRAPDGNPDTVVNEWVDEKAVHHPITARDWWDETTFDWDNDQYEWYEGWRNALCGTHKPQYPTIRDLMAVGEMEK